MAFDLADIQINIRETGADRTTRSLNEVAAAGARLEKTGAGVAGQTDRMREAIGGLNAKIDGVLGPIRALQGLFAATFGAEVVKNIIGIADSYQSVQARIELAVGSAAEGRAVFEKLYELSQRSRTSFEDTASLFARIAMQAGELGKSNDEMLKFVELMQKAIVAGGSGAQEAAAGIRQMAQALGSGKLSGDEFRSMMENLPGLARALANGLGVPVGALKDMAAQGKLTSEAIVDAMLKMEGQINASFEKMPATVGQAWQQLQNVLFQTIGRMNEATGFTQAIIAVLHGTARDIENLAKGFRALGDAISFMADRASSAWDRIKGFFGNLTGGVRGFFSGATPGPVAGGAILPDIGNSDLPASQFHDGGRVGVDGRMRMVPAHLFHGAPRFHDGGVPGLGPGEVPAILQSGEMVLTEAQARQLFGTMDYSRYAYGSGRYGDILTGTFFQAARSIQRVFADTFEKIFEGGKISFEGLADAGTKIFNRMAGDLASSLLFDPLQANARTLNQSGSFLGIGGGTWGMLGMVGGNLLLDRLLGPRQGSFADLGSLVGGLAGSAFGPLGMVGGSLLGNVFGGLFGKKSSGPSGRANLVLDNGQFALGSAAGDNGADISGLVSDIQNVAKLLNAFKGQYGLTTVGSGWLGALGLGNQGGNFVNASPEDLIASVLRSGALRGTGTVGTILANTQQTTLEGIASDLDFAKVYDSLVKVQPEMTATEKAISDLTTQFADAKTKAAQFGLSVQALDSAMQQTLTRMRDQFNEGVQDAILGITDPDAAAMKKLEDQQEQRRKDAIALGADLVEIDRLSGLERQKLLEDQNRQINDSLRKLIDDMTFGSMSPLSAADRLSAIQGKYSSVSAAALAGDKQAREDFDAVARQYLDIARENYASGAGFQAIYEQVLTAAQSILAQAPGGIGAANDNVVSAVESGTNNIVNAIDYLREENAELREEIARLHGTMAQFLSGQTAAGGRA